MARLLLALVLYLLAGIASAHEPRPMPRPACDAFPTIMQSLATGEYREQPFAMGFDPSRSMGFVLFGNRATGTWTIVLVDSRYLVCSNDARSGDGFKLILKDQPA